MKKRKNILIVSAIALALLVADGAKSYFLARREVTRYPNLECKRVLFVGVWLVTFQFDGAHRGSVATFTVAPLVPWIIGRQYCR